MAVKQTGVTSSLDANAFGFTGQGFDGAVRELPVVGPFNEDLTKQPGTEVPVGADSPLTKHVNESAAGNALSTVPVAATNGPGLDQARQLNAGAWKQTRGYTVPPKQ